MSKTEKSIVLVRPEPYSLRKPNSVEPLGLEYLAAQLEKEGINVKIIDGAIKPITRSSLQEFSVVGMTATTPEYSKALRILELCKDIPTILGGPHVTAITEQLKKEGIQDPGSTFVNDGWGTTCSKEGDLVIADIVNEYLTGFIEGPRVHDLDSLPFPARHLVNPLNYSKEGYPPAISILFSRGCPWACTYCDKSVMGRLTRFRSVENVVEEIKHVIDTWKIRSVLFYDDTLTLNRQRAMELFDALSPLEISFECNSRVNTIDKEMLAAMKEAGCYKVKYGIESGDEKVLRSIDKDATLDQALEAIRITKEAGITAATYFLFGLPEDNWHSLYNNLAFLEKAQPDSAQLAFAVPYPNTPLYKQISELGWEVPNDWREFYYAGKEGPHTYLKRTKHLNEKEFAQAKKEIQQGFARWATEKNNGSFNATNVVIK